MARKLDRTTEAWLDQVLRQTADDLLPSLQDLIAECVRYVEEGMPELAGDQELAAGLEGSAADNLARIFVMLSEGTPVTEVTAPPRAIEYAEIMVRRGTPLATLLRAYRLGTMWFWTLWRREVLKRSDDPELLMLAVDRLMSFVFGYVDRVSEEVTEEYGAQRERWARSAAALRQDTVQSLIDGAAVDADQAGRRLGYELRGTHVAFVLWSTPDSDLEDAMIGLERAGQALARQIGCASPLLVSAGRSTLWMWAAVEHERAAGLEALKPRPDTLRGVHAACGEPAAGIDGFVASHREAVEAHALAMQAGRPAGQLVRYSRVVVPSLLVADPERARRFVQRELGELCGADDATVRVRATLQVFLQEGSRYAITARRLGIHQNTVHYRVRRAEELLGRPVTERRFEIEAALRLLPIVGG